MPDARLTAALATAIAHSSGRWACQPEQQDVQVPRKSCSGTPALRSFITRMAGRATASLASILPARKRVLLFIYSSAGIILIILETLISVIEY